MRPTLILFTIVSLAACRTSKLGHCSAPADCPSGTVCDTAHAVCVAPANACFPICDGAHACDTGSLTCVPAQAPEVAITSPAAGSSVSGTLQAAATARAPGGVSAISFELRDTGGTLLIAAAGTVSAADASAWSASISLSGVATGAVNLTAVATYPTGAAASAPVALTVQSNACFPSCPAGQSCQSGSCVASACNPVCDAAHVCVSGSCQPVTTAAVTITSPADGSFATGTLTSTATAQAPGSISGVRFDLSIGTSVAATVQGTVSGTNPTNFSASLPLAGVPDGTAQLVATLSHSGGTVASAPISVIVDQTAPVISMTSDGRSSPVAAGQSAAVTASITDGPGSGVKDSSVALTVTGHAAIAGAATAPGVYSFAVPIDDSLAPAGASTTLLFQIAARDVAGNAGSLSGDPKQVIRVDRDSPQITAISYTPAPVTDGTGRLVFGTGGGITVQATITDGAGVAPTSVCLRVAGETGTCAHQGLQAGSSSTWTFPLPRPAPPQDGSAAFNFTLEADDTLAAALTGASQAEHQTRSAQVVYFDYAGPSITVLSDATPYARTPVPIPVSALITDPSGVPDGGVFLNGTLQPSSRDGGLFVFQLDARGATAGVEGPYGFQVSALDNLGNAADAGGTRIIDDAPPVLTVRVFKGADPGTGSGVIYPPAVANTGWNASRFIYSDTVHVKGTLTDVGGLGAATVHIDGIELDGGVSIGAPRPLGCAAGATACSFDLQLALNDLAGGNGRFHTGIATVSSNGTLIPSGTLQVVVGARDRAVNGDGTPAAHSVAATNAATATRFLWQQALPAGVSGLAVHPSGDVIATLDGGTGDTVFDLAPDQPLVRWSYGSDAGVPIGPIPGTPAIGAGGATARTYIASSIGDLYAIEANGSLGWWNATPATSFVVGPAVAQVTINGTTLDEVVEPDSVGGNSQLWRGTSILNDVTSVASADRDFHSAPLILNGKVFFAVQTSAAGTTSHLTSHTIAADGSLGAASTAAANPGSPYYGLITDGTNLFAAIRAANSGTLQRLDQSFAVAWTRTLAATTGFSSEPTIGIDGKIYAPDFSNTVTAYDAATGAPDAASVVTLSGVPMTPLQGSDGHLYVPRKTGFLAAYEGNQLSWMVDPPNAALRQATMDCSGRLFMATGATVFAFVTDDHGLADTPWPSLRRDARNTGNAGALKYGIRTAGNVCLQ